MKSTFRATSIQTQIEHLSTQESKSVTDLLLSTSLDTNKGSSNSQFRKWRLQSAVCEWDVSSRFERQAIESLIFNFRRVITDNNDSDLLMSSKRAPIRFSFSFIDSGRIYCFFLNTGAICRLRGGFAFFASVAGFMTGIISLPL